ncbi:MAG: transglycosylase SLT domain-containing protein [Spirochaetaceae bacterium]|jgi:hypothetical protein|nr:transglycosylase SLT domain-containing protein [Spirochaetaceae bacterium]
MRSDFLYPFLTGSVLTAMLGFYSLFPKWVPAETDSAVAGQELVAELSHPEADKTQDNLQPVNLFPALPEDLSIARSNTDSLILNDYRTPATRESVIDFFAKLVKNREVAAIILAKSDDFDVNPSLAFALCWVESKFKPRAVNTANANSSIDRGLFQLNNRSFPKLTEADFYNPETNARYGISHLAWCMEYGGSVVSGLAMYNAGSNRVKDNRTPRQTLAYIDKILEAQKIIEATFATERQAPQADNTRIANAPSENEVSDEAAQIADEHNDSPKLALAPKFEQRYPWLGLLGLNAL